MLLTQIRDFAESGNEVVLLELHSSTFYPFPKHCATQSVLICPAWKLCRLLSKGARKGY